MTTEVSLESRKAGFQQFYEELMPVLVDFAERMGISPAHEVLRHAGQFAPLLDNALQSIFVDAPVPRSLGKLLAAVDAELADLKSTTIAPGN